MRRRARTCALQILYQLDTARELPNERFNEPAVRAGLARFWASFEAVDGDDEQFAERMVLGIAQCVGQLDTTIGEVSQNWRVNRMDKVDRNILRLATYELTACPDIPRAASINEAVELAKLFSSPESAAFINGVLDQLARDKPEPQSGRSAAPVTQDYG